MLAYKALQVIAATREEPKDWEMNGKKGTTHAAMICVLGHAGKADNLKVKAKSAEELHAKLDALTLGKPYDFPIIEVVPIFKAGDRRPSAYEFVADIKPAAHPAPKKAA
jgi:hypothetical protein